MTRDELKAWAMTHIKAKTDEEAAFYVGVFHAGLGTFDESRCGEAGWIGESEYCAGGREGLLRLEQGEPAGRLGHGDIVEERT